MPFLLTFIATCCVALAHFTGLITDTKTAMGYIVAFYTITGGLYLLFGDKL